MSGTSAAVSGTFADMSGGFADVSGTSADMSGILADVSAKFFLRRKSFVDWDANPRCGFASGGLRSKTPRLDPAHPVGVLPRKGLEGCGAAVGGHAATAQPGPERVSAEPRKARFFAEQKMRPNEFWQKPSPSIADAVRKVKDDFFCEADKEEINKELLKEQV
jgi:hypothetical protein